MIVWKIDNETKIANCIGADSDFNAWIESWKNSFLTEPALNCIPTLVYLDPDLNWKYTNRTYWEKEYAISYENSIHWCVFFTPTEFKYFVENNAATIVCIKPFMDIFKYAIRFDND